MKRRKRHTVDKVVHPKKFQKEKLYHELDLLNSKAVIAVGHYLDYGLTERATKCMEKLFSEYKKHKEELKKSIVRAFQYFMVDRYILDPEYPMYKPTHGKPSESRVKETKKCINEIAKKIWKK